MADLGTPGSNADSSINAGKGSAAKDKACPFCHQAFTSSSLGRHLDLYIKEKNPKPADGVHDVDAIRKLRGGITRRQARNSLARREESTPIGKSGINGNSSASGTRSPQRDDLNSPQGRSQQMNEQPVRHPKSISMFSPSWEATGVINDIPMVNNGAYSEVDGSRRVEASRTASRQVLAKAAFEQKQKLTDALDTARAAELALREVLGAIKAAT